MIRLTVPDMTCGHCKMAVETALKAVDADASVRVDLASHMVEVESASAPDALLAALAEAGYPARRA